MRDLSRPSRSGTATSRGATWRDARRNRGAWSRDPTTCGGVKAQLHDVMRHTRHKSVEVTGATCGSSAKHSTNRIGPAMLRNHGYSDDRAEGPWNPGIRSELTRELLLLSTIFRPENVFGDLTRAMELRDVTGLPLEDLAIFRPDRLALHELLVRVTADYEIPDPEDA